MLMIVASLCIRQRQSILLGAPTKMRRKRRVVAVEKTMKHRAAMRDKESATVCARMKMNGYCRSMEH